MTQSKSNGGESASLTEEDVKRIIWETLSAGRGITMHRDGGKVVVHTDFPVVHHVSS